MLLLIDACPLSSPGAATLADGNQVELFVGQAIVWLSITPRNVILLPSNWPRFPAVLDTGFNAGFLISERQLRDWAKVDRNDLASIPYGRIVPRRVGQQPVPAFQATLWIHRDASVAPSEAAVPEPVALYPSGGILVTPPSIAETRLPLIGTDLLRSCGLRLSLEPVQVDPVLPRYELQFSLHSLLES